MKLFGLLFSIAVCLHCTFGEGNKNPKSVAIIGDSISVGSMTSKELVWDILSIDKLLVGPALKPKLGEYSNDFSKLVTDADGKNIPAPKRLWEKLDEIKNPPLLKSQELRLREKYMGGYLDMEEYSWGYLLARAMKVEGNEIYMPGLAGNRASDILMQVKRILRNTKDVMPDHTYIFMTGNDLCSNNLNGNFEGDGQNHSDKIVQGLAHLLEKGTVAEGKDAKVFVVSHLPVVGLIDDKAVLEKKIYAYGKERTCEELRAFTPDPKEAPEKLESPEAQLLMLFYADKSKNLPPVSMMCRSVLTPAKDAKSLKETKEKVDGLTKAFQKYAEKAVEAATKLQKEKFKDKKVSFHFLKSPKTFKVEPDDVANDCFHFSLKGQERFARTIAGELKELGFAETDLK